MRHKTEISILIVTHNHDKFIKKLLDSLDLFDYDNVYICDANSSDHTLSIIQESRYSKNLIIKKNLEGFSKNNNDLIKHFKLNTKYFLLLNPDIYFQEDFILKLFNKMEEDDSIGITTPLLLYPNGAIQASWKKFPNFIYVIKKRVGLIKSNEEKQMQTEFIDWCLGACMLIRSKYFLKNQKILDERYRLYCEDIDICFQAKFNNHKVIGVLDAKAYHYLNEKSSKVLSKYNYWNISSIFKFIFKWNFHYFLKK